MNFCQNCGAALPEGKLSCPDCGAKVKPASPHPTPVAEPYRGSRATGGYASPEPAFVYADKQKTPDRVLGVGAYFGSILLLGLPVVGILIQIIWALGGTNSKNRRNMARAWLIFTVLGALLCYLSYLLFAKVVVPEINGILAQYGFTFDQLWQYVISLF